MDTVRIYCPNAMEIEAIVGRCSERYVNPYSRSDDVGFGSVAVFPKLYLRVSMTPRIPEVGELAQFIASIAGPGDSGLVMDRSYKLAYDFCRELHCFALLTKHNQLSNVSYESGNDLGYDVDYTAYLNPVTNYWTEGKQIGIQAAMRYKWTEDQFTVLKKHRRDKRSDSKEWKGLYFTITNKNRPPKRAGHCWLFTPLHVQDLVDEALGLTKQSEIGVQIELL